LDKAGIQTEEDGSLVRIELEEWKEGKKIVL
jgi:hypothetical protein